MNRLMKKKPNRRRLCYLNISSWVGVSIGAVHYYGRIMSSKKPNPKAKDSGDRVGLQEVEVKHPLTQREATALNKANRDSGDSLRWSRYKRGELSHQFETADDVRKAASAILVENFGDNAVLLDGHYGTLDPMPMIVGPDELKAEVAEIVAKCEEIDWWEKDEPAMQALSDRYWKLMNSYGLDWKEKY